MKAGIPGIEVCGGQIDEVTGKRSLEADIVVIAVDMKPKNDLALKFFGVSDRFYMIGDCNKVGNVQKAMRTAFSTASML